MTNVMYTESFILPFWETGFMRSMLEATRNHLPYRVDSLSWTETWYIVCTKFSISITGSSPANIQELLKWISYWRRGCQD